MFVGLNFINIVGIYNFKEKSKLAITIALTNSSRSLFLLVELESDVFTAVMLSSPGLVHAACMDKQDNEADLHTRPWNKFKHTVFG